MKLFHWIKVRCIATQCGLCGRYYFTEDGHDCPKLK